MKEINKDKANPFGWFEVEKGERIIIPPNTYELHINLCYVKPDGALDDCPSLAFILQDEKRNRFYAQITLETLKPVINRLIEMDFEADAAIESKVIAAYADVSGYLKRKKKRIVL